MSNNGMPGVAPVELIREDFRALDARETLRTTSHVEDMILMQSVGGHAHEGHGLFYGQKFPNTTIDDIARALQRDPNALKTDRQNLIDEIRGFARRVINGEAQDSENPSMYLALNGQRQPLLRIGAFRVWEIKPFGLLRGLYLGGLRDTVEVRAMAEQKYGATIGYGKSYLVNKRVMMEMGLSGDKLAREAHGAEVEQFMERGLIVGGQAETNDHVSYMYIRHQTGPGASDDAAIVAAGLMYDLSTAVGVFLADAIDTLEKYAPVYNDQDYDIARYIANSYLVLDVVPEDAARLAHLASGVAGYDDLPDSSLRHLLAIDRKQDQCALESHLLYVSGKPYALQELDHGQTTNARFYDYLESRLAEKR